jgi:4-hydroxybenzoate polyprenyltransferase/phosphoserine phosphatase
MISTPNRAYAERIIPLQAARPLCVDLDGTLVKSDTLVDSLLLLARTHPLEALKVPLWVLKGKAALKAKVASIVSLDVGSLPYNRTLLSYLHEQYGEGREIYLTTGADRKIATRVADHLGIFSDVLASDGSRNLIGGNKLASLKHRFETGFDYVGNSGDDLPLLAAAGEPMLARPNPSTSALLRERKIAISRTFEDRKPILKTILKALRPHQWAKNLLIFVPLLLAHTLKVHAIADVVLAFICFSLCASASYVVNDLFDVDADRRHPKKRFRPFAAGDLPASTGLAMALIFLAAAFIGAHFLPPAFLGWLLFYTASTLAYSLYLKRVVLVDVVVLSGLYTLRLLAGGAAAQVKISPWLAGFSIFLFLSLAIVKRFSELQNNRLQGNAPLNGRGYLLADIEQLRSFGTASAYAGMVVFSMYISGHEVITLYKHAARMWLIVPLMILWISRVWLLAGRGHLDEDPVIFAVTDRMSLVIGFCVGMIVLLAI